MSSSKARNLMAKAAWRSRVLATGSITAALTRIQGPSSRVRQVIIGLWVEVESSCKYPGPPSGGVSVIPLAREGPDTSYSGLRDLGLRDRVYHGLWDLLSSEYCIWPVRQNVRYRSGYVTQTGKLGRYKTGDHEEPGAIVT